MSINGKHRSEAIIDRLMDEFEAAYGDTDGVCIARAPGRVNLLGDHTDYNDGFVFPMTLDRAIWLALRRRDDDQVRLHSANFEDSIAYPLSQRPDVPASAWSSYVSGVIEELRKRDLVPGGFEGVVYGDVPLAGGLSSSAAVEVATAVSVQHLFGFDLDPVEAVKLCQSVEHNYVGVQCGIMDQFVSRLGQVDHGLFLDCRSLDYQHIPLPLDEWRIVVVNTGVKRALAGSKYNERRAECEQGVAYFAGQQPGVRALRDVSVELLEQHGGELPELIGNRCRHVVTEDERVRAATEALRAGRMESFGQLMNESHASLRDLYEVSCDELDELVSIAQNTDGVAGARMTGAGFGGCTVNLVRPDAVLNLGERIERIYRQRFDLEPTILVVEGNIEAGPVEL